MFKDLIKKIAAELSRREIPYMIIGGQAVLHYGEPRLTKDIDITLGVGLEGLPLVKKAVKAIGLTIEAPDADVFVRETMVLPTSDRKTGIRVDLVLSFSPFEREAIERAKIVDYDNIPVRFASLEDLVIHKIVAGRPRDLEDVNSVLLKNPGYDGARIRRYLSEFDRDLGSGNLAKFDGIVSEIGREAARRLARLGGTGKDLKPIRRRRSSRR